MIKKLIFSAIVSLSSLTSVAQTEFRHITFEEAKQAAKTENKKIFVDFYTQWCGPCKKLANEIFPLKTVGDYLNANFVCLKLDAENEGASLALKVGVEAYPTIAVFNCDGEISGSFSGFRNGDEFISAVENCGNPEMRPEAVAERYESGARDAKTVQAYVMNIMDTTHDYDSATKKAGKIIDEYFNSLSPNSRLKSENLFVYVNYTWDYSNPRVNFILENLENFISEDRPKIHEMIGQIYYREALRYFSSNELGDNEAYRNYTVFKQRAEKFGLPDKLKPVFEFCEKRKNLTDEEYLTFCDDNFSKLEDTEKAQFLSEISSIFPAETDQQKRTLSSFIRKHIGTLHPTDIYFVAHTLNALEKKH